MKVDPRCVSAKWHDRQVLSPSFSCPLKISLSLHLWTFKVILRCASAALADPRTALPSSLLSVCLPCQAERKTSLCVAEALCSPSFPIVCTPTATSIHRHAWTHTHTLPHIRYAHSLTETSQVNRWKSESPNRNKVSESTQTGVLCWPSVIMDEK